MNAPLVSRIHPRAEVDPGARLGEGVTVWQFAQIREGATIGNETIVGMGCYIDAGVVIGNRCKLQSHVCTYAGLIVEDEVFLGPAAVFTNDLYPRACTASGAPKGANDWTQLPTRVGRGASVSANATILCGIRLGEHSMVGAGSVVTRDVPAHGLVRGNPARLVGFVGKAGFVLELLERRSERVLLVCPKSGEKVWVTVDDYQRAERERGGRRGESAQ